MPLLYNPFGIMCERLTNILGIRPLDMTILKILLACFHLVFRLIPGTLRDEQVRFQNQHGSLHLFQILKLLKCPKQSFNLPKFPAQC